MASSADSTSATAEAAALLAAAEPDHRHDFRDYVAEQEAYLDEVVKVPISVKTIEMLTFETTRRELYAGVVPKLYAKTQFGMNIQLKNIDGFIQFHQKQKPTPANQGDRAAAVQQAGSEGEESEEEPYEFGGENGMPTEKKPAALVRRMFKKKGSAAEKTKKYSKQDSKKFKKKGSAAKKTKKDSKKDSKKIEKKGSAAKKTKKIEKKASEKFKKIEKKGWKKFKNKFNL
jgi:hypothetical protein